MKKYLFLALIAVLQSIFYGCSPKEKAVEFTDYETVTKDRAFRSEIKIGNFVELSNGYTYYEYEKKNPDTVVVMVHGFRCRPTSGIPPIMLP